MGIRVALSERSKLDRPRNLDPARPAHRVGGGLALALALASACTSEPIQPADAPIAADATTPADAPAPPDGVDTGQATVEPTPGERAACANLARIAPCTVGSDDQAACLANFASLRTERVTPACRPEYDALVDCIAALSECPGTSVLCPIEYSALGRCTGPGL